MLETVSDFEINLFVVDNAFIGPRFYEGMQTILLFGQQTLKGIQAKSEIKKLQTTVVTHTQI